MTVMSNRYEPYNVWMPHPRYGIISGWPPIVSMDARELRHLFEVVCQADGQIFAAYLSSRAYCAEYRTEAVHEDLAHGWLGHGAKGKRLAAKMIELGLWRRAEVGYYAPEWVEWVDDDCVHITYQREPIPKARIEYVLNRDGRACVVCGDTEELHVDHVIPVVLGGHSHVDNLQTLCARHNIEKGALHPDEWRPTE